MLKILKKIFSSTPVSDDTASENRSVCSLHHDDNATLQVRGNVFLAAGNFAEAERCYRQAVSANPANAEAYINLGFVLMQQDRSPDAARYLNQAVEINPRNADGFYMLATLARTTGHLDESIGYFEKALEINPGFQTIYGELSQLLLHCGRRERAKSVVSQGIMHFPTVADFHYFLGNVHIALGEYAAAIESLVNAVSLNEDHSDAHFALGNLLVELGRTEAALGNYRRATEIKPEFTDAFFRQANALLKLNRSSEALVNFNHALKLNPNYVPALVGRGAVLLGLQQNAEALVNCDRVVKLMPDSPEAFLNKSAALQNLGRYEEALTSCERALVLNPEYLDALINQGTALSALNRYREALESYQSALRIRPDCVDALLGMSIALFHLSRCAESVECCTAALGFEPGRAQAYLNRGLALMGMNQSDLALQNFAEAIELNPTYADAHFNESLCRLLIGEFDSGWKLYEWRWQTPQLAAEKRRFSQPLWTGKQSLQEKTILVHCEQGFGDTIQFCRYTALLAARGATVVLEVQAGLKTLLVNLTGARRILDRSESPPLFDYHSPLMSLPLAFNTSMTSIPAPVAYIIHNEHRAIVWQARLGQKLKPRIGIVWSGSVGHKNDLNRSVPFAEFCALLSNEIQFISLQKEVRSTDRLLLDQHSEVAHYGNDLRDFTETAALIANVDLVISVDTSVAHLAGAMGKPLWLLLPFSPDWRWLLDRMDSPWYPSFRLYRQTLSNDWSSVIKVLKTDIGKWQCEQESGNPDSSGSAAFTNP